MYPLSPIAFTLCCFPEALHTYRYNAALKAWRLIMVESLGFRVTSSSTALSADSASCTGWVEMLRRLLRMIMQEFLHIDSTATQMAAPTMTKACAQVSRMYCTRRAAPANSRSHSSGGASARERPRLAFTCQLFFTQDAAV